MNKDQILDNIIRFVTNEKRTTIGNIYIKFHMMNKKNEFLSSGEMPVSAEQIIEYVNELCIQNKLKCIQEENERFYIINYIK